MASRLTSASNWSPVPSKQSTSVRGAGRRGFSGGMIVDGGSTSAGLDCAIAERRRTRAHLVKSGKSPRRASRNMLAYITGIGYRSSGHLIQQAQTSICWRQEGVDQ